MFVGRRTGTFLPNPGYGFVNGKFYLLLVQVSISIKWRKDNAKILERSICIITWEIQGQIPTWLCIANLKEKGKWKFHLLVTEVNSTSSLVTNKPNKDENIHGHYLHYIIINLHIHFHRYPTSLPSIEKLPKNTRFSPVTKRHHYTTGIQYIWFDLWQ